MFLSRRVLTHSCNSLDRALASPIGHSRPGVRDIWSQPLPRFDPGPDYIVFAYSIFRPSQIAQIYARHVLSAECIELSGDRVWRLAQLGNGPSPSLI